MLLLMLSLAKKATSSFLPIFCLKRLPPLPFQRASGLDCTPCKKRSRAKASRDRRNLGPPPPPPSHHHFGGFLFDFYFASWSREECGGRGIQPSPSPSHPLFVFSPPVLFFFFCNEDRRLRGDAFGRGVCVGLRGALTWRDSTLAKSRAGIFFFFPLLLPCLCSLRRCAGSSRPTSEMNMEPRGRHSSLIGDTEGPGAQRVLGSRGLGLGSVQK